MNVLSINCCGTKKRRKRVWIKDLCFKHNIQFLGIHESKMTRLELFRLKSMWGNYSFDYARSLACGRSGGIISIWDPNSFVKKDIWCDDSFVIVKGCWKVSDGDYFMVNIYVPQDPTAKGIIWNRITDFMQAHRGKYVIFGDLNEVRFEYERLGSSFYRSQSDLFISFINNVGLIELPIGGRLFTWMNKAGTKLSKLDRFLFSGNVVDALPDLCVTPLDRFWSDHSPILLHCNKFDYGPVPFRLCHSWFQRDGFDDLIMAEWNNLGQNVVNNNLSSHEKLKLLKIKDKQWLVTPKNNMHTQKQQVSMTSKDLEAKIEANTASSDDCSVRI